MSNTFVSDNTPHALSGEWDFEDHGPDALESICVVPHGWVLPAVTYDHGEIFFVTTSGILAMSVSGIWHTTDQG